MHTTRKFSSVAVKIGLITLIDKKRVQKQFRSEVGTYFWDKPMRNIFYSGTRQPKKQGFWGPFPRNSDF